MIFSLFKRLCDHHLRTLPLPKKKIPYTVATTLHSPSTQILQPLIYTLPLCMCLFWTVPRNRTLQDVASCVWLISLCTFPRFTKLQHALILHSFLWLNNNPWYGQTIYLSLIDLAVDGCMGCFYFWAIMNNVVTSIHA